VVTLIIERKTHGCVERTSIRDVQNGFVGRECNSIGHNQSIVKNLQSPRRDVERIHILSILGRLRVCSENLTHQPPISKCKYICIEWVRKIDQPRLITDHAIVGGISNAIPDNYSQGLYSSNSSDQPATQPEQSHSHYSQQDTTCHLSVKKSPH
jgi:hypothetical protein